MKPKLDIFSINRHCYYNYFGVREYYSYNTLIAFEYKSKVYCSENDYGPTTGKMLNNLEPDKKNRISHKKLMGLYEQVINKLIIIYSKRLIKNENTYTVKKNKNIELSIV